MQSPHAGGSRFQEQIVVLEQRIAQAMFEQTWCRATGDTVRRREADLRVEVLQIQLTLRRQQRPP